MSRLFDRINKYVATHRPDSLSWQNSKALGPDVVASLRQLKQEDGPNLMTQGSTEKQQRSKRVRKVDCLSIIGAH